MRAPAGGGAGGHPAGEPRGAGWGRGGAGAGGAGRGGRGGADRAGVGGAGRGGHGSTGSSSGPSSSAAAPPHYVSSTLQAPAPRPCLTPRLRPPPPYQAEARMSAPAAIEALMRSATHLYKLLGAVAR